MGVPVDPVAFDVISVWQDDHLHTAQPAGHVPGAAAAGPFPEAGSLKEGRRTAHRTVMDLNIYGPMTA